MNFVPETALSRTRNRGRSLARGTPHPRGAGFADLASVPKASMLVTFGGAGSSRECSSVRVRWTNGSDETRPFRDGALAIHMGALRGVQPLGKRRGAIAPAGAPPRCRVRRAFPES